MNVDKLRNFCLFIDRGSSYEVAAKGMGLTPSGLFRSIRTLQEELGCKFFDTINGDVVLTEAGQKFYHQAQEIIEKVDIALESLQELQDTVEGDIRISTTQALASLWMAGDLASFIKINPRITFHLLGTDQPVDLLKTADVGIRPKIEGMPELVQTYLTTDTMNLYASEDYVKLHGLPKNAGDLGAHRLIGFEDFPAVPYSEVNWHLHLGKEALKAGYYVNSGVGILKAVENHLGIGPVSGLGIDISRVPLVRVLPKVKGPDVKWYFQVHKARKDYKKIVLLRDYLVQWFSSKPGYQPSR